MLSSGARPLKLRARLNQWVETCGQLHLTPPISTPQPSPFSAGVKMQTSNLATDLPGQNLLRVRQDCLVCVPSTDSAGSSAGCEDSVRFLNL